MLPGSAGHRLLCIIARVACEILDSRSCVEIARFAYVEERALLQLTCVLRAAKTHVSYGRVPVCHGNPLLLIWVDLVPARFPFQDFPA